MKIATWNIARNRKGSDKMNAIIDILLEQDADILVLTETVNSIDLGAQYKSFHTTKPTESYFRSDERRVGIYSKYDFYEEIDTFRSDTSICVNLDTPLGPIAVYGTIIGTEGNRSENFMPDLEMQVKDFERISKEYNLCICGDLNISFSDSHYFTEEGRRALTKSFAKNNLINLTSAICKNIDHIVISKSVENNCKVRTDKWNDKIIEGDPKLSDHMGISVTIIPFEE